MQDFAAVAGSVSTPYSVLFPAHTGGFTVAAVIPTVPAPIYVDFPAFFGAFTSTAATDIAPDLILPFF